MEDVETFTLTIELGNDTMRTPEDVATVLTDTAEYMQKHGSWPRMLIIRDVNGNSVGLISVT
jgi:hypothetical protein